MGDSIHSSAATNPRLDSAGVRQIEREIATLRQHLSRMRNRPDVADAKTLRTYEEMIEQRQRMLQPEVTLQSQYVS